MPGTVEHRPGGPPRLLKGLHQGRLFRAGIPVKKKRPRAGERQESAGTAQRHLMHGFNLPRLQPKRVIWALSWAGRLRLGFAGTLTGVGTSWTLSAGG